MPPTPLVTGSHYPTTLTFCFRPKLLEVTYLAQHVHERELFECCCVKRYWGRLLSKIVQIEQFRGSTTTGIRQVSWSERASSRLYDTADVTTMNNSHQPIYRKGVNIEYTPSVVQWKHLTFLYSSVIQCESKKLPPRTTCVNFCQTAGNF